MEKGLCEDTGVEQVISANELELRPIGGNIKWHRMYKTIHQGHLEQRFKN